MELGKTSQKLLLKFNFGRSWAPFETLWASLGRSLAPLGFFFLKSKLSFFEALVQDKLQEAFGIDFGMIWKGFWEGLRRSWENFWQFWNGF